MKSLTKLAVFASWLFILSGLSCPAADPPAQAVVSVEIYELPQAKAVVWQMAFEDGAEPERHKLFADLRTKVTEGVKTIGVGQRICTLDKPSCVETVEMYRYPTEFAVKDGFASPTAFEVNNVGCTMSIKVTSMKPDSSYTVDTDIRDVALLTTQHYAVSKTDQPGSIMQPVFSSQVVGTSFQIASGVPKLVSVYSPHTDEKTSGTLRFIFVTIRPDR